MFLHVGAPLLSQIITMPNIFQTIVFLLAKQPLVSIHFSPVWRSAEKSYIPTCWFSSCMKNKLKPVALWKRGKHRAHALEKTVVLACPQLTFRTSIKEFLMDYWLLYLHVVWYGIICKVWTLCIKMQSCWLDTLCRKWNLMRGFPITPWIIMLSHYPDADCIVSCYAILAHPSPLLCGWSSSIYKTIDNFLLHVLLQSMFQVEVGWYFQLESGFYLMNAVRIPFTPRYDLNAVLVIFLMGLKYDCNKQKTLE